MPDSVNGELTATQADLSERSAEPSKPDVQNYLGKAIVAIFLFPPTALIAVWFAAKVNELMAAGDYDGALAASGKVRTLSKVSLIIAPIWILAAILIPIILARM